MRRLGSGTTSICSLRCGGAPTALSRSSGWGAAAGLTAHGRSAVGLRRGTASLLPLRGGGGNENPWAVMPESYQYEFGDPKLYDNWKGALPEDFDINPSPESQAMSPSFPGLDAKPFFLHPTWAGFGPWLESVKSNLAFVGKIGLVLGACYLLDRYAELIREDPQEPVVDFKALKDNDPHDTSLSKEYIYGGPLPGYFTIEEGVKPLSSSAADVE
ncbi:hypothetical protein QOT17_017600 [Balamuthia mandrillaris]